MNRSAAQQAPFGSILADTMAVATYRDGKWSAHEIRATGRFEIHPAAHVLHYGSECFEGFKAYKWADGSVRIFRMDRHVERIRQSARLLAMPEPDAAQLADMVVEVVRRNREVVPDAPGALYLRPLLIGTMENIGAASTPTTEALLFVLASPVWDYFAGGAKPLRILVDDEHTRTASHMGMVKSGGNYAAAMVPTIAARKEYAADQVLFCPGGEVQETGAANFLLLRKGRLVTRGLDSTFLHGVTRDSLLTMARDSGYRVEERIFDVNEMLEWAKDGEAALAGTAAVLAGVGTLIHRGREHKVGDGQIGPVTRELRATLVAVQTGQAPDRYGWLRKV
jgi:branched-chain amino acid aminotransferase